MMTFRDYVKYYEDAVLSMGKVSSIKSTKSRLRICVSEFGDRDLPLSSMDVQRFVTRLSTKSHPQTVHNIWRTMRTVLARAKVDGIITEVPAPILPKVEREEQGWFKPEEMRRLAKYEPLYAVAAETGARIGELLALQVGDIDLENKTLTIRRNLYDGQISSPKTRAGTRTISISRWLAGLLYPEIRDRAETDFTFQSQTGGPRAANTEGARLNHICGVYGIPPHGFHAFRRGNATLQASIIGVPEKLIAYRLGHSNLGLTLGRYAKYLVGMDREWADKIGDLLK